MLRTHAAGSLPAPPMPGGRVTLAGWVARRRDHGGVIFIDLRDTSGVSRVMIREGDVLAQAHRLRARSSTSPSTVSSRSGPKATPTLKSPPVRSRSTRRR